MPTNARVRVQLDKKALDRELLDRTGTVGRLIAGFSGQVTQEIKSEFRSRAGGAWWPVSTSVSERGRQGVVAVVTVRKTKAHRITAINASALVFFWEREGRTFVGSAVNHPGSTPPEELILSGIKRASRRVAFARATPTVASF